MAVGGTLVAAVWPLIQFSWLAAVSKETVHFSGSGDLTPVTSSGLRILVVLTGPDGSGGGFPFVIRSVVGRGDFCELPASAFFVGLIQIFPFESPGDFGFAFGFSFGFSFGLSLGFSLGFSFGFSLGLSFGFSLGLSLGFSFAFGFSFSSLAFSVTRTVVWGLAKEVKFKFRLQDQECNS